MGGEIDSAIVKRRSLGNSMAITMAANGLISLLWLISGMLAARLLGPKGRGELAAIQTWGLFLATFALIGMPDALVYFSARAPARSGSYTVSAVVMALLGGIPLLGLAWLAMPLLLSAQTAATVAQARLYLLVGITAMLGQVPLNALRGRSDFVVWNALRVAGTALGLMPLILAWAFNHRTAGFVATTHLIFWGVLFSALILIVLGRRVSGPYRAETRDWKPMLAFGLPCVVTVLPQTLNLRLDQMLMAAILAPQMLGLYVVSVAWAATMTPLFQAVSVVLFPHLAAQSSRAEQALVLTRTIRLAVPSALCLAGLLATMTPFAIPLIFGSRFQPSVMPAVVLVFAGAVFGVNQILEEGLRGLGSPKAVMWSEVGGLMVTFALLGLLLGPMGIMGAAIASLLGYGTVGVQLLYRTRSAINCSISEILVPRPSEMLQVCAQGRLMLRGIYGASAE
jgi:O-antigen/teichoic acid export membrane protein